MEKSLQKNIFKISLPIFVEMLFFTLLGTIDTLMLNTYSNQAVGSVVNANGIINLFNVTLTVIATGVVVVLTKTLGAKNKEDEPKIVGTGLIFNMGLGLIVALILFLAGPLLLNILGTGEGVIVDSISYIKIIAFGMFALAISQACGAIFRSYGKPYVIMIVAIISNIVNVILNYTLIFGNFGLPELGVTGAAIGTLTSNILSATIALGCLYFILGFSPKNIKFSKEKLKDILSVGLPSAFEHFLYNFSQFIILIAVNMIIINGTTEFSSIARGYVVMILNYVMLFSLSIANGNQIIVGYYIGEKNFEEAKKFTFKSFRYILLLIAGVLLILNIFWKDIIGLLTEEQLIIDSLKGVFIVAIFFELGRACNVLFIAALRAVGDIIFPVIMGVISMYGIAVFFSFLLAVHFELGLIGIFIAQAMDECFRGIFMLFRFKNKELDFSVNTNVLQVE